MEGELMHRPDDGPGKVSRFIERWKRSGASERANYVMFLEELCRDVLEIDPPDPACEDDSENHYVFERLVRFREADGSHTSGRIDLYKRGCFVLEAKQGVDRKVNRLERLYGRRKRLRTGHGVRGTARWDGTMLAARQRAEQYARALPAEDGWPPFLIVVDVGHCIELYVDFSQMGKAYVQFPDNRKFRIPLTALAREETRETLRAVWTDPASLDPARRSEKITRQVAERLARLARSLEQEHPAEVVAGFLMRCLFTMFAEDVGLLPKDSFTEVLRSLQGRCHLFESTMHALWRDMDLGGFSPTLRNEILCFNGGLFSRHDALPLTDEQLGLLILAAEADWHDVEPAVFGTLLERALDPRERHKLGAHYTPRAYVERLVIPTVIEPLRKEWNYVKAAAVALARGEKLADARDEVDLFHRRLCEVRVLDPACGSGNFLYVTLEHMKRLEGEVIDTLQSFGGTQTIFGASEVRGYTVSPEQFLGIELNPRAAAIAEVVLWIGYLQWHFRTRGRVMPPEPVLKRTGNIECRDALLAWEGEPERVVDETGEPVTRWDGYSMKKHPVTGIDVPDETERVPVWRYPNPRTAEWPAADFVVGNPPFIGNWKMREELGDGYVETLRRVHRDVSDGVDYVMYWWNRAAHLVRKGKVRRFGFITTNSISQTRNRKVLQKQMSATKTPLSILFAVPDHPWVHESDGAAVRISMTAAGPDDGEGRLLVVTAEEDSAGLAQGVRMLESQGAIHADLTVGPRVSESVALRSNQRLCSPGIKRHGEGFLVTPAQAERLGLNRIRGMENHLRHFRHGKDISGRCRGLFVIDLFGLDIDEVRERYPSLYQWVHEYVKPERDANRDRRIRENWWLHGRPRPELRLALKGLARFIATIETSKHRHFVFLDSSILPDNRLLNFALSDAYCLGVLSSSVHVCWALAAGGTLEDRPTYTKTRCFDPFPFPDCSPEQKARIRQLAEQLDAHRKQRQEAHPGLTMTAMYNVLLRLRSGEPLTKRERVIHEQGLVSVLKQIHDDLDSAVFDAYGWPPDLSELEILERVVTLNRERAEEESRGIVRWLRPEFQDTEGTGGGAAAQAGLGLDAPAVAPGHAGKRKKRPWPGSVPEQVQAIGDVLALEAVPLTVPEIAARFSRARKDRVEELAETLVLLGQARKTGEGKYGA